MKLPFSMKIIRYLETEGRIYYASEQADRTARHIGATFLLPRRYW